MGYAFFGRLKRSRLRCGVMALLYGEGLSTRDFRRFLGGFWGDVGLSKSSVSRANKRLHDALGAWRRRIPDECQGLLLVCARIVLKAAHMRSVVTDILAGLQRPVEVCVGEVFGGVCGRSDENCNIVLGEQLLRPVAHAAGNDHIRALFVQPLR